MLPTGALTDDLSELITRETAPLEVPTVVAGCGVPSVTDGSPSRDRLARIAAMIGHAEQALTGSGQRERRELDARLVQLVARGRRTQPPAGRADVVAQLTGWVAGELMGTCTAASSTWPTDRWPAVREPTTAP